MKKDKLIYYLTVEDVQTVANDELDRDLSPEEIETIIDGIAENIKWYDAISYAIMEKIKELAHFILNKN